jgi:uncharacterized membrane protein HdeD (DUF308 family)
MYVNAAQKHLHQRVSGVRKWKMPKPDRHHWKLQLVEGIILVVLGVVAVFVPFRLEFAFFVWLFFIAGVAGLITTLVMRHTTGFWWSLLSATLAIGVAVFVFATPEFALLIFPLLLLCFLVLEGIITIMFALDHWRERSARWNWMLASGIFDLSLAALIVIGLPETATGALGLILAANLIFGGGALIGMALAAHGRLTKVSA